jgi:hypothetical protein
MLSERKFLFYDVKRWKREKLIIFQLKNKTFFQPAHDDELQVCALMIQLL